MSTIEKLLSGGDIRSLGKSAKVITLIHDQEQFDELFSLLKHPDRVITMRTGDVIEKVTKDHPEFLFKHKKSLIKISEVAANIELKWHLALLLSRLKLNKSETGYVWDLLTNWVTDKNESRIVRVNSLQALFELQQHYPELQNDLSLTIQKVRRENIPSLNARIKKLSSGGV